MEEQEDEDGDEGRRSPVSPEPGVARMEVVVRGTNNLQNAIDDLEYVKVRDERLAGVWVHSGFQRSALALWRDLQPRLNAALAAYNSQPVASGAPRPSAPVAISFTGHSLGASSRIP